MTYDVQIPGDPVLVRMTRSELQDALHIQKRVREYEENLLRLKQDLKSAGEVADGKVKTYLSHSSRKEIAVPAEEARRQGRSIKLAMEAFALFASQSGLDQKLLRPLLLVVNAVSNAERGATDPIFMPPRAPNRGPRTDAHAQISGMACAAIERLQEIVTQKEAAKRTAKEMSKAGIISNVKAEGAVLGRRRQADPFSETGLLSTFYRMKAMDKKPPKERNRNHTKRELQFFQTALGDTENMAPEEAYNTLMANLRIAFGRTS